MVDRIDLQKDLEKFKDTDSVRMVKFQPPESIKLIYPCIIYNLSRWYTRNADNTKYFRKKQYTVTIIDRDPDSKIAEHVMEYFPYSSFDRRYVADNLYHDVLTIYY